MISFLVYIVVWLFLLCTADTYASLSANRQIENSIDEKITAVRRVIRNDKTAMVTTRDDNWLAESYKNLGMLLQTKETIHHHGGNSLQKEALDAFNNALLFDNKRSPSIAIHVNYLKGTLLMMMGLSDDALAAIDAALAYPVSKLDRAALYGMRADILKMMGEVKLANTFYNKSIEMNPSCNDRYFNYINTCKDKVIASDMTEEDWLQILKRLQDALKRCEDGDDPEEVQILNPKAKGQPRLADRINVDEDEFSDDGGEFAVDSKGLVDNDHSFTITVLDSYIPINNDFKHINTKMYSAIYNAAEQAKRYALAWWYLNKGNEQEKKERMVKFNRQEAIQQAGQISTAFTASLIHSLPVVKDTTSNVPIFIVGFMRCGSTLLETMLDSHSQIWGMGENSFFNANLTLFRNELVQAGQSNQAYSRFKKVITAYSKTTAKKMLDLANFHLSSTNSTFKKKAIRFVVDKMLFNYRNIGFIHIVHPNSLIIHVVRDPMDTLFSCFKTRFDDSGLEWALDISDLVLQYALYLQILDHYRTLLPGRLIEIRYDELVRHPKQVLRKIVVDKLHLKWDSNMLDFHLNNRAVQTNSQSQVKRRLYNDSIGYWRSYVRLLEPMLKELGGHLDPLLQKDALPFRDKMNWKLDLNFDYELDRDHNRYPDEGDA